MATLGRLEFICVKFRPLELVKTNGFVSLVCLVWRIGEAWLTDARSAREVARDNIFATEE